MDYIKGSSGIKLRTRSWIASNEIARVILVHGYAEHADRYNYLGHELNHHGISLFGYDHRGHGKSEGRRAYIDSFTDYLEDLSIFHKSVDNGTPLFIYGHSLGGLIVAQYVVDYQPACNGILLSAAALKVNEDLSPILQKMSGILGKLVPKMKTIKLESKMISKDQNVVRAYEEDPLVYTEGIPARTGAEILATTKRIQKSADSFSLPVLIMHGGADQLTEPAASKNFFTQCASTDKELQIYDGLYHEIINEPEKDEVIANFRSWILDRI